MKIEFAPQNKIEQFSEEVDRITDAVGIKRGGWYSDESRMGDFGLDEIDFTALFVLVGRPVQDEEYLWEVARDLANRTSTN